MEFNLSNLSGSKPSTNRIPVKVLVLGAGPAGYTAALYAARADLEPVLLTGMEMGGQVSLTFTVENYPGFPDGVGGAELAELFQKQAVHFGTKVEFDTTSVDLTQRPFVVQSYNNTYLADSLIIATGATPRHLKVPGEVELTGRGVSYCATCDGWFFKGKQVVVVGGGDSALEEGLFLTRFADSVTIVHRRDTLRAGAVLIDRANANPKIKFIWNTIVTEVVGTESVVALKLQNVLTGEQTEYPTHGLFIFIGHDPNTQIFKDQLEMDDMGYLKTDQLMHTNIAGVFVAGEAADPTFRQVVTSAGMGAAAAMQAGHFLDSHAQEGLAQEGPAS